MNLLLQSCRSVSRTRMRIPLADLDARTVDVINHVIEPTRTPPPPPPIECAREEDEGEWRAYIFIANRG